MYGHMERSTSLLTASLCGFALKNDSFTRAKTVDLGAVLESCDADLVRRSSAPWATPLTAAAAPPPPASPPRPVSVVVGAGPAGILTAVFLARRGHEVHVFDRLPNPLTTDSSDKHRAFVVLLRPRGAQVLAAAGFDVSAFPQPGLDMQPVQQMVAGSGIHAEQRNFPVQPGQLVGSRHAFVCAMLAQAQQMHPDSITFHWGTSFEGVDIAAKTATFSTGSAAAAADTTSTISTKTSTTSTTTMPYDLLVAADGGWSRVRRAAEAQVPELSSQVEQVPLRYKVFRGLPASPAQPMTGKVWVLLPTPGSMGGSKQPPASMFMVADPSSGAVRGVVTCKEQGWAQLETVADYEAFINRHFPALPPEWVPELAAQLATNPLAVGGMRVHASQLHAPSIVLVGDAGHGVTPRTGNGMNAALEDAWLLDKLLEEAGPTNDYLSALSALSTLPQRFTAARLEDAQALLWLDASTPERTAQGWLGHLHPQVVGTVGRLVMGKLTRGWVRPPPFNQLNDGLIGFAEARKLVQRDNAVVGAAAVAAAAAAVAAVALACRRA